MKKIYSLLFVALMSVFAAQAVTVTVNVDVASHFKCVNDDTNEPIALVDGDNVFELSDDETYRIEPASEDYIMQYYVYGDWYELSYWFIDAEETYYQFRTIDLTALVMNPICIIIDQPEKVNVYVEGISVDYNYLDLVEGENFFDAYEGMSYYITVSAKNWREDIYEMTINGERVEPSWENIITGGDIVQITYATPQIPVYLTVNFLTEDAKGIFTMFQIGDNEIPYETYTSGQPIEANYGNTFMAYYDDEMYENLDIKFNGEDRLNGSLYEKLTEEQNVLTVSATKKQAQVFYVQCEPGTLTIAKGYYDGTLLTEALTPIEFVDGQSFHPEGAEGYVLQSGSYEKDGEEHPVEIGQWALFKPVAGATYTFVTCTLEEARTATLKVTVDDAAAVQLKGSTNFSYGTTYPLEDGENIIKFIPTLENQMQIKAVSGTLYLVKIKYPGDEDFKPLVYDYGYYVNDIVDGTELIIMAKWPEGDAHITWDVDELGLSCLSMMFIGDDAAEDMIGVDADYPIGTVLGFTFNQDVISGLNFEFSVCGETTTNYYYEQDFTIKEDGKIVVKAREYADINYTINVTKAQAVRVVHDRYQGYTYGEDQTIVEGANVMTIKEKTPYVSVVPQAGYALESCKHNGVELEQNYQGGYWITVAEGDVIDVVGFAPSRDNTLVVWVDGLDDNMQYFGLARGQIGSSKYTDVVSFPYDNEAADVEGYHFYEFADGENNWFLNWYGTGRNHVYLNGEKVTTGGIEGTANGSFYVNDVEDLDVLKVFLQADPKASNIGFFTNDGLVPIDDDDYLLDDPTVNPAGEMHMTVTYDKVRTLDLGTTNVLECFAGTEVSVVPEIGWDIYVMTEDDFVKAELVDGVYTFIAPENEDAADFTIAAVKSQDIDGLRDAIANSFKHDVYNLQGMKVRSNASASDVRSLAPGMYIVGGKKVIVK